MGSAQKLLWPEWLLGGEQRVLWPGWLVESAKHWERKKVPHLRWSQAPPLPWLRRGRRISHEISHEISHCILIMTGALFSLFHSENIRGSLSPGRRSGRGRRDSGRAEPTGEGCGDAQGWPAPWMGLFRVGILMELSKFTAEQRCGCGSKPNCFPKCVAIHIPTKGIFWQHVWIQICAHSPPCWCKANFFLISFGYCNPPFFWYTA